MVHYGGNSAQLKLPNSSLPFEAPAGFFIQEKKADYLDGLSIIKQYSFLNVLHSLIPKMTFLVQISKWPMTESYTY